MLFVLNGMVKIVKVGQVGTTAILTPISKVLHKVHLENWIISLAVIMLVQGHFQVLSLRLVSQRMEISLRR